MEDLKLKSLSCVTFDRDITLIPNAILIACEESQTECIAWSAAVEGLYS